MEKHQGESTMYPAGYTVYVSEVPFVWDGSRFRNSEYERAEWASYRRRFLACVVLVLIAIVIANSVTNGMDWDAMTLSERAPYKTAGRIGLFLLLPAVYKLLVPRFPPRMFARVDEVIKNQLK